MYFKLHNKVTCLMVAGFIKIHRPSQGVHHSASSLCIVQYSSLEVTSIGEHQLVREQRCSRRVNTGILLISQIEFLTVTKKFIVAFTVCACMCQKIQTSYYTKLSKKLHSIPYYHCKMAAVSMVYC